jgi:hypothetical protein
MQRTVYRLTGPGVQRHIAEVRLHLRLYGGMGPGVFLHTADDRQFFKKRIVVITVKKALVCEVHIAEDFRNGFYSMHMYLYYFQNHVIKTRLKIN